MGIQSCSSLLFRAEAVPFDLIVFLLESLHASRAAGGYTTRDRPKVSIDASLIGYHFIGKSTKPSTAIAAISGAFVRRGIDVVIDMDGSKRHHSKRASQSRAADRDRQQLQLMESRATLNALINSPNETVAVKQQKEDAVKVIRDLERKQSRCLPSDFVATVKKNAATFSHTTTAKIDVFEAPFQTDPCIAKRAIDGDIDAIVSGDSDFAMYVGPCGPDGLGDLMLCDLKLTFGKGVKTVECITIKTGQNGQKVLQPIYSKGDYQFDRNEVLHSAAVAVVRSGNERAVGRCKMSWFVKRGCIEQTWDINLLCDMWEAWSFQVNFMYDKYL